VCTASVSQNEKKGEGHIFGPAHAFVEKATTPTIYVDENERNKKGEWGVRASIS